ncbi:MAG: hypothetical protein NVS2B16_09520 [Chloroflexota bacterium]
MIGQRYVAGTRAGAPPRTAGQIRNKPLAARPAAGRLDQVLDALGRSVLVQLMLAMTLVALAAMIYLAQASQASVLSVRISNSQDVHVHLELQNANLHDAATQYQSLTRIETLASNRLHMSRADLSTTIWINPEVPRLTPLRSQRYDLYAAQQRSEPRAWLQRVMHFVVSSL